jgi:hypothetical protein
MVSEDLRHLNTHVVLSLLKSRVDYGPKVEWYSTLRSMSPHLLLVLTESQHDICCHQMGHSTPLGKEEKFCNERPRRRKFSNHGTHGSDGTDLSEKDDNRSLRDCPYLSKSHRKYLQLSGQSCSGSVSGTNDEHCSHWKHSKSLRCHQRAKDGILLGYFSRQSQ